MLLGLVFFFSGALNALALPVETITKVNNESYFLPDTFIPRNYTIEIDVTKSFTNIKDYAFFGKVVISGDVMKDKLNEIRLHASDIIIDQKDIQINSKPIKSLRTDTEREFLILIPSTPLTKGQATIEISNYNGTLRNDMNGFYVSEYTEKKNQKYVLTTQFQPTHARKAFPCFDEPRFKATFQLTFKKEKHYKVLSNTKSIEPNNGVGATEVHFPKTVPMSTYLVAFIVSEFENAASPNNSSYNVWARPEAIHQSTWATKYMYAIVQSLNKFTNITYDEYMEKMDMAALPDFSAGAMENWGLLTYRETALLVKENVSTTRDIQYVIAVIAHEIAHQWFGDLVTCHWWMNTWLNEGFATYFEYHTTGDVLPEWEMEDQYVLDIQQSVFGIDALAKTTPLTLNVETPTEISSHFGSITYSKGGSVIRMMRHFLGNVTFQEGLRRYLDNNRLGNTVPEDLWSAIQEVIDERKLALEFSLSKIMSNWISTPGYPVVTVEPGAKGYFTLSQQRFHINPEENTKANQYWFVPISYTTSSEWQFNNTSPKLWLTPNEPAKTIATDSDYIIVNVQETGYYRVNYATELWQSISNALITRASTMHRINRAQIVDDVLNLARADFVDYPTAFNVIDYLKFETEYYPWRAAFNNFRFLLQRYSDTDETGKELRMYLDSLMVKIRDKEFEKNITESHVESLNRVQALQWACDLEYKKCVSQAQILFTNYRNSGSNENIPTDLRSVVYCSALRHGDKNDWNFLWGKYETSNSAAEKSGILNALGCSSDENILRSYLEMSIGTIRKQDASYVFTAVYTGGNSKGVDVAFQFLSDKHAEIIEYYDGKDALERVTLGLAGRLTDKTKIAKFKVLLQKKNFEQFRDAAIEIVDQNVAWAEKYSADIGSILNKKRNGAAEILANKYVVVFLAFISIYFSLFKQ